MSHMDILTLSIFQSIARDEAPEARLNWLDMAAERASTEGANVLICPELSLSGHAVGKALGEIAQTILGEFSERVAEIALLHDLAIVYGYPEQVGERIYNSTAFVTPEGKILGHHRKSFLPKGPEQDLFSVDDTISVFDYAGWRISLLVGYDIEFPEIARQAALAGADLLIVPAALETEYRFVAETLMPARAWENGVFLACANWAGQRASGDFLGLSSVIGPDGVQDAIAGTRQEILVATIDKTRVKAARERLPYLKERRPFDR